MLIREPELGYNTENKRLRRGGRARSIISVYYAVYGDALSYHPNHKTGHGTKLGGRVLQKRDADVDKDAMIMEDNAEVNFCRLYFSDSKSAFLRSYKVYFP